MPDEKDRFGDKLRDAERAQEDQYFAQRDKELLDKLKKGKDSEVEEALRAGAHGRCPRDGSPLATRSLHDVSIDECPKCKGMWLDHGELESLAEREKGGFFYRWFVSKRES